MTAYTEKDALKMNAPLTVSKLVMASALLCVGTAWSAADSAALPQKTLYENLRSLDFSNPGVLFTGELRSGINSSVIEYGDLKKTEIGAASEGDFVIQARPTKDTRATVKFRVHQDWQKSHEEGSSPYLFDWWSYDGRAHDGKINFNLGDMRVRYTPLTIATPRVAYLQEPEMLKQRREDVMAYRNLDGSDSRMLQGLNFSYNSGAWGVLEDLYYQGTVARLRNQAKKTDQVFFDFDESDRYMFAGRVGVGVSAFTLGFDYVSAFNREKSARNFFSLTLNSDSTLLEDNSVMSGSVGVDAGRLLDFETARLKIGVEYGMSSYESSWLYKGQVAKTVYVLDSMYTGVGEEVVMAHYITPRTSVSNEVISTDNKTIDGKAMLLTVDAALPSTLAENSIVLRYVQNDKDFISELAQSPMYYMAGSVLNSQAFVGNEALNVLRGSTMENLYYAVYTNDPLTQLNLASATDEEVGNLYLLNNYKKSHNIRTGYTNASMTPSELASLSAIMDPGVNLSMPFGLATPDRKGVLLDAQALLANGAIEMDLRLNSLSADEAGSSFLDMGVGLGFQLGSWLDLGRKLNLNGAFEQSKETDGLERSSTRYSAGANVGVWKALSLQAAYQVVDKDYGKMLAYLGLTQATGTESLLLVGPEIEIAEGSSLNLQYGLLKNELSANNVSITLDRTLISADVRVKF